MTSFVQTVLWLNHHSITAGKWTPTETSSSRFEALTLQTLGPSSHGSAPTRDCISAAASRNGALGCANVRECLLRLPNGTPAEDVSYRSADWHAGVEK